MYFSSHKYFLPPPQAYFSGKIRKISLCKNSIPYCLGFSLALKEGNASTNRGFTKYNPCCQSKSLTDLGQAWWFMPVIPDN
jgi:hypothetical protein